jgi:exopolysaccharide production protein ExoZ
MFAASLLLTRRLATGAVVGAIALVCLFGYLAAPSGRIGFWTNPIIMEFAFGCILGLLYVEGFRLPRRIAVVLMIVAIAAFVVTFNVPPVPVRPFVWGLPAAALVAAACLVRKPWVFGDLAAPLHLLGDASYALYLVHVPVLLTMLNQGYSRWAIFWSAIAIAILMHFVVEKPILWFTREWLASHLRTRQTDASPELTIAPQIAPAAQVGHGGAAPRAFRVPAE